MQSGGELLVDELDVGGVRGDVHALEAINERVGLGSGPLHAARVGLGARRNEAVPAVLIDGDVGLLDTDLQY